MIQTADAQRALLTAGLGFAQVAARTPELEMLRDWLNSWPGVRWTAVAVRSEHQVLVLRRRPDGWMATFTCTGPTKLPKAAPSGLGTAPTPGLAVQIRGVAGREARFISSRFPAPRSQATGLALAGLTDRAPKRPEPVNDVRL